MNKFHLISIVFFILSFIFLIFGFISGDVEGGIFIIFPFVKGSGLIGFFGIICLFLSFLFFMLSFAYNFEQKFDTTLEKQVKTKSSKKFGGVVFIAPIPVIFGSNLKIAIFMMILALIIILVSFFMLHFY